jgi:hypothetical protein
MRRHAETPMAANAEITATTKIKIRREGIMAKTNLCSLAV